MANLKLLELTPAASKGEIRQAYMNLVKVWHPDRFPEDEGLRDQSEERFKQVQVAYRELQEHAGRHAGANGNSATEAEDAAGEAFAAALKMLLVRYADRHQAVFADRRRVFVAPNIPAEVWREISARSDCAKGEIVGVIRTGGPTAAWNTFVVLAKDRVLIGGLKAFAGDAISYNRFAQVEVWVREHGHPANILERWTRKLGSAVDVGEALHLKDAKTGKQVVLFENINGDRRIAHSLHELLHDVQRLARRD